MVRQERGGSHACMYTDLHLYQPRATYLPTYLTCLIADRRLSVKRTGSSPPSPVFERPPKVFIATAKVSWVSPIYGEVGR